MSYIFNLIFYNPLYNGLIFLLAHLPHADVGIAVIIFTAIVRLILFPLSKQAVKTQMKLKEVAPELEKLKADKSVTKEKLAQETMAIYSKNGINPFAGFFLALLQIPIILALYFIFLNGGLPNINAGILYSFVKIPQNIDMNFLGLIDISKPYLLLGILAGVTQFFQVQLSIPPYKKDPNAKGKSTFQNDLARSMNVQMRYILPLFIVLISLKVSGAVALYWITGNLFTIGQEIYMRKTIKKSMYPAKATSAQVK